MTARAITRRPLALTAVLTLLAALLIAIPARQAEAAVVEVAYDMVGSTSLNLTDHTNAFAPPTFPFGNPGDGFQKYQRGVGSIPFAVLDDSLSIFPGDSQGIIKEGNTDVFFGIVDTESGTNSGPVSATWTFDISSSSDPLKLSIDMGAMGDFEIEDPGFSIVGDFFRWEYSIDGGAAVIAFESTIDEAAAYSYVMEDGTAYLLDDPAFVGATQLTNDLQTLTTDLVGTGNELVLTLTAEADGASEAFAFQNIVITSGEPDPVIVLINEVDADTPGTDSAEFIELYDGGVGNTPLDGMSVVLWNGSDDQSYEPAFDLDGFATDADGYFVICGDGGNTPNCDLDSTKDTDLVQNGTDAVLLLTGDAASYPNDTALPLTDTLLDAIVYDTSDSDDAVLLAAFTPGHPQVNEGGSGNKDGHSNQRCANGAGAPFETEVYEQWAPTPGAENICEIPEPTEVCGDPVTLIHAIQGTDAFSSPLEGETHSIEGVVIGDFQGPDGLSGVFVQEEGSDADDELTSSEGIFVRDAGVGDDVAVGDIVRATGTVSENNELTQLDPVTALLHCTEFTGTASETAITLPVADLSDWEDTEGMLISIDQLLYASGNFTQGRFGEVDLSINGPLDNPTNVVAPGVPANDLQDLNDRSRIQLDDGSSASNPMPLPPYIGVDDTLRTGDTVDGITGAQGDRFGTYEVHPTQEVTFARANARPVAPPFVGGSLTVAAFNVLNYFTTIDEGANGCFPSGTRDDCRGADTADELATQRAKIVSAIGLMDADVVGLMEIENFPGDVPTADLVTGLNDAGFGPYDYIATGAVGTDAIRQAIIYQPASVTPFGAFAVLDASFDPDFNDDKNRPVVAQSFVDGNGEVFTVAVNHLKSKGSNCDAEGDPDVGDGQGNCNGIRTAAAEVMATWLGTDPTGSGDPDVLIIGDLNAYANEDPITALEGAGYTDLIEVFVGEGFADGAYSFNFFSQSGYLDHGLANATILPQVTGAAFWHINADEPSALDYNDFNQPALSNPDPWRSSDHDPVLIGLAMTPVDITPIYEIQGTGPDSPFAEGTVLTTEGVVVGDFQAGNERGGFYLQAADQDLAEDVDGDASSNGIFINDDGFGVEVAIGEFVQVTGVLDEQFGLTAIDTVSDITNYGVAGNKTVAPTSVALPFASGGQEAVEGMLVVFDEAIYVSDTFNLGRFGEAVVSQGGPLVIPTNENAPGAAAIAAQDANNANQIILDDGSSSSFFMDPPLHIAPDGTLRRGDSAAGVTGVMTYGFGSYRIDPTVPFEFTRDNPREDPEDLGGDVRVASFNLWNFWTTYDDGINGARGADSQAEFDRQLPKTVAAILELDAAVVGLQELENNGAGAIGALVDGLNAATAPGTWAAVPDPAYPGGLESTNAIKVGIIYQPALATPVGASVADDDAVFAEDRPPIAQTFEAAGETFTVIVNHFKSKSTFGGVPPGPDEDQGDGQGAYNARRTAQAAALIDFVAAMQATSGDRDVLVIGDFNSYRLEDPITTLNDAFTNLMEEYVDVADQYSLVFFGQQGLLDYAFAAGGIANRITGVDVWHGHADEPRALDYNDGIQDAGESSASNINPASLYVNDQWRASDHDALVVAFRLSDLRDDKEQALGAVSDLLPTGTWWGDWRIQRAISSIEKSLEPHLWVDGNHVDPGSGAIVFIFEKHAVRSLLRVRGAEQPGAEAAIEALVAVDRGLAATLIGEAAAAGADTARAERWLARGDSQSRPDRAIDMYRRAWTEAKRALGKVEVRFATFNASLNRSNAGDLVTELAAPGSAQPSVIAEIIQRANPDVLLINEFDYDAAGLAAQYFQDNYLSVSQGGAAPVDYPYWYVAPSNTGVYSGFDLDNSGAAGDFVPNDSFGFGFFPGQFGMAVASKYPLDLGEVRTFQNFLWKDMPGALVPEDPPGTPWYSHEEMDVLRLSSKSHWDIPVVIGDKTIHFLTSHPTPPVFDGPEDRNGTRNHDEIRFWADYVEGENYMYDDNGKFGGLPGGARFVIAGDQNSDPNDGDSIPGSIQQLLDSSKVNTSVTPESLGAVEQAVLQGGINAGHVSLPKFDTADFSDSAPGNLRVDYVLPSKTMTINDAAVFWPETTDPLFPLVGTFPFPSSDHRLVWVDVNIARGGGFSWWGTWGSGIW